MECVVVGCRLVRGDILNFGGGFVAAAVVVVVVVVEMVVGGSKVEVVAVVRIVCSCVNGEVYSLWCLSQKFWRGRCVVMWADSLMECCLWEVTGSIEKVVVVKMVVGVVESIVMADSRVLFEVVMVQLIVWQWMWVMEGVL